MKKLGILLLLATMSMISCTKEDIGISGQWVSEQDNPNPVGNNLTYYGYINNKTTAVRTFTSDEVKIFDDPKTICKIKMSGNSLIYDDFVMQSNKPSCSVVRVEHYNIRATLHCDTLIETGKYRYFIDGVEVKNYDNKYIAKFVKRN